MFDGSAWDDDVYYMIVSMIIVVNMSVRMVKCYFKIKSSKTTPQYRFWKESNPFHDEGYQSADDEFEKKPLDKGLVDVLPGMMKGKGCADGNPQQKRIQNQ